MQIYLDFQIITKGGYLIWNTESSKIDIETNALPLERGTRGKIVVVDNHAKIRDKTI